MELLDLKHTHFVLWRPRITAPAPRLIIGRFQPGDPPTLGSEQSFDLAPLPGQPDLWGIAANDCHLNSGEVYHYWFEVTDSNPYTASQSRIRCTDPTAWTVDWRLLPSLITDPLVSEPDRYPASVILFQNEHLEPCDPNGQQVDWDHDPPLNQFPSNNHLVIYELPTSWARTGIEGIIEIGVGTFRDVIALIEPDALPANFGGVTAVEKGHAHLRELGVNALELLPPADSYLDREWGYATSNYFAADFDLGLPEGFMSPTASTDLVRLIKTCHQNGMRFFDDVVMAFATRYSYRAINFLDFFVQVGTGDPEEVVNGVKREGFGGDLFKYNYWVDSYDPFDGTNARLVPARNLMYTYLKHWMNYYRIDGIRMDSVTNIANWDFVGTFKDKARSIWKQRWQDEGLAAGVDERFLVIGEELSEPMGLLTQQRLDALWHEGFKRILRYVILGQNDPSEPSFEWSVRKLIDCRLLGFTDGVQAINYVTSHDVEGFRNERLYNFLNNNGVVETEQRIKLAFVCLLTAVGIPMIFAGEEFADQHDLAVTDPQKQIDPVKFERREEPWRKGIFEYVSRLVSLRRDNDALSVNDTTFFHADFAEGKRVIAWLRGQPGGRSIVAVVANFSAYGTPNPFSGVAEYVVPNWPNLPQGMQWREVTQNRLVPAQWAGREPIFPWEAKVYEAVPL